MRRVVPDMPRDVIEVVARWGDTILDVAYVEPNAHYTIGTSRVARLVVPGVEDASIVDRGTVWCPPNMVRESPTRLRAGLVTIDIVRASRPETLPAPALGRRMPAFLIASLLAHLSVWFIAAAFAPLEPVQPRRLEPRRVHVHVAPDPEPEPPPPAPPPAEEVASPPPPPPLRRHRPPVARPVDGARLAASLAVDTVAIARQFDHAEPVVDPDDVADAGFGDRPRWEAPPSVPSGGYTTSVLPVRQCAKDDPRCQLDGPTTERFVRGFVLDRMPEIFACFQASGRSSGTIVVAFTIRGDGTVKDASGDGEIGACAARVVETITFRAQWPREDTPAYDTRVRWPITFR